MKYGNKHVLMTVSETVDSPSNGEETNVFDYVPDYNSERQIDLFLSNEEMKDVFERILNSKRNKPFKKYIYRLYELKDPITT